MDLLRSIQVSGLGGSEPVARHAAHARHDDIGAGKQAAGPTQRTLHSHGGVSY